MNIIPNAIIRWAGTNTTERILCEVPGAEGFYTIRTDNPKAWPVFTKQDDLVRALENYECAFTDDELARTLRCDEALTDAQRQVRDNAWSIIKDLVNDPTNRIYDHRTRTKPIQLAAQKHGVCTKVILKYLRRYWQGGQTINALQAKFTNCGAPNKERLEGTEKPGRPNANGEHVGIRVTKAVQEQFDRTIKKFVLGNQSRKDVIPFTKAFERMCQNHYTIAYDTKNGALAPVLAPITDRPTFDQFRYYYGKRYGKLAGLKAKLQGPHYQQNCQEITSVRSQGSLGIGDVYEIDSTTADVYLVSSKLNEQNYVVGRPVVYFIIDTFSQLIAGFHVTFFNASYNAASMAIWNAYSDKTQFCKSLGVTLDDARIWPAKGIPHSYRADRGELASRKSDVLTENLGIVMETTQAYSPRAKALVERHFRLRNDQFINWLPGAVPDEALVKGRADYRKDAALTIEEFTEALVRAILSYNECVLPAYRLNEAMILDNIEPRPYRIWEWALTNANKLRDMDPMTARLNLLPRASASVTERGIRLNGLFYTCAKARLEEWFTHANAFDHTWKIQVSYDPGSVDYIYLVGKTPAETEICELQACDRQFAGWTWAESDKHHQLQRKIIREGRREDEANVVATGAQIQEIAQKAIQRRKANGPPNIKRMAETQEEHQTAEAQKNASELHTMLGVKPLDATPAAKTTPVAAEDQQSEAPNSVDARWNEIRLKKKKEREQMYEQSESTTP